MAIKVWRLGQAPKNTGIPQTLTQQLLGGEQVTKPGEAS